MTQRHGKDLRRQRREAAEQRIQELAARNPGVPRGRPVTVGDISGYALSGHQECRGRGMIGLVEGKARPCKCATKRFLKAHPEVVVDGATGEAFWPATVQIGKEDEVGNG